MAAKKPRKYQAKLNPLLLVSVNQSKLTEEEKRRVLLSVHSAMYSMTHGTGSWDDWQVITGSINLALVLDELTFLKAYQEPLDKALCAHFDAGHRCKTTQRLGYSGPQLQAINYALEIHTEQLDQVTFKELQNAINDIHKPHRHAAHKRRLDAWNAEEEAHA